MQKPKSSQRDDDEESSLWDDKKIVPWDDKKNRPFRTMMNVAPSGMMMNRPRRDDDKISSQKGR